MLPRIAEELKIPVSKIGLPNSVFSAAYGLGKFFGSILTDYLPCAEFHTLGILLCGMDVAAVSLCRGIGSIAAAWSLQGALQALGWPFLSRVLLDKLPKEQCAKYWGVLSMAGNVGAMAAPYGTLATTRLGMSWRSTLRSFGASSAFVTLVVHAMLRRGGASKSSKAAVASMRTDDGSRAEKAQVEVKAAKATFRAAMLKILRSPAMWALFFCNSLSFGASKCTKEFESQKPAYLYFQKSCFSMCSFLQEWGSMYLRGTGLAATEMQTATLLFWAEIGGSLGAAFSGVVSASLGGRHALTCTLSALLGLASTSVLAVRSFAWRGRGGAPLSFGAACALQACSLAGINGVRTLAGLHLFEVARHHGLQLGPANGLAELIGQVGSVLSGLPVGAAVGRATSAATAAGFSDDRATRAGWAAVPGILTLACGGMSMVNLALLPSERSRLASSSKCERVERVDATEDEEVTEKLKGA
ncbi:unnamed protein product [Prorocentrum cordatum]|uniref:Major facilitator superfamily (MFS) profile domain-containing protein n=1 Tax=Prorocentrum cordatum TaxID=2364126 RepID=A0ABN9PCC0_9DINO|nr:unnamed protein product [Polarella glacialis]